MIVKNMNMFRVLKRQSLFVDNRGIAALLVIVIIASATLIMAYGSALLGIGELDMGYVGQKGREALSVAEGCIEEAFYQIHINQDYGIGMGDMSFTALNGSCIIGVTGAGTVRTISSLGNVGNYYKKVEADILLNGSKIIINSWKEVDTQ